MIVKFYNLKKSLEKEINFYLLYGKNTGLIEDTINNILKPSFSKNIFYYDELEILSNLDSFREKIFNNSFFENDKLIIINRVSEKLLKIIQELIEQKTKDLKVIIKCGALEKKSKLRNFFEKNNETVIVPFYEDDNQTLMIIAQKFFKEKKIKISSENINYIVRRSIINTLNLAGFTSMHNYPSGQKDNNHWGKYVTILDTTSGTPYYFNFHVKDFIKITENAKSDTIIA